MQRRVVVTGLGVVSPIGVGAAALWQALLGGNCGIRRIVSFVPSGFGCQIAGEVAGFKVGDFVPKSYRKATKVMARDIELAVAAADLAFRDAGIESRAQSETPAFNPLRFGCNIGAGLISADLNELTAAMSSARDEADPNRLSLEKWGREGMGQLTPLWLLKYLPNMLACHVTIVHGLMGPSNTITCDTASSHLAIGEAFRTIQRGKADMAVCGGAESRVNPMGIARQQLLGRLNETYNDRPESALRPFAADAAGTVFGEGGGLMILEELECAKRRGARIYAELAGFGASQDSSGSTEPDPSGHSYGNAIAHAMRDARITSGELDVLVPAGVGIATHDRAEFTALRKALGADVSRVAIAPVKAGTGQLGAGSGVDAVAAVLCLHHGLVPGAPNSSPVAAGIELNLSRNVREQKSRASLSCVFSVGGQNAALVFKALSPD